MPNIIFSTFFFNFPKPLIQILGTTSQKLLTTGQLINQVISLNFCKQVLTNNPCITGSTLQVLTVCIYEGIICPIAG